MPQGMNAPSFVVFLVRYYNLGSKFLAKGIIEFISLFIDTMLVFVLKLEQQTLVETFTAG